jgi:hypothetical protein
MLPAVYLFKIRVLCWEHLIRSRHLGNAFWFQVTGDSFDQRYLNLRNGNGVAGMLGDWTSNCRGHF